MKISKKIVGFNVNTNEASDNNASENKASAQESAKAAPVKADVIQMHETLQRPDKLIGSTYKLKVPDHVSSHAMYITINDVILNEGTEHELRRPFEVFINSKNLEHYQWIVALTLIMSATFRKGGDITFLVEELKSVFDPRGGYWNKGKYMPSIIAELGNVIEQHLIDIGMLQAPELDPHQQKLIDDKKAELNATSSEATQSSGDGAPAEDAWQANATHCNKCNHKAVMVRDGCATCLNCGDSKCGSQATADQIFKSRLSLGNQFAHLDGEVEGEYSALSPTSDTQKNVSLIKISDLRSQSLLGKPLSDKEIKLIVKAFHREIYLNRELLFDSSNPIDPIDMLDPKVALKSIGFQVDSVSGLGQYNNGNGQAEVAGYIDSSEKVVGISNQFPAHIVNFTAGHELGHAVLHEAGGMHRDRALDGGKVSGTRGHVEIEADRFASFFLMPERLVRKEFQDRFGTKQFLLDDTSAFLLTNSTLDNIKKKVKDSRQLARILAESERYGSTFTSLKSRFKVSTTAMSIRLEELNLIKF